jgi:hypothetical protein
MAKNKQLSKTIKDKLINQSLLEIEHAREYKKDKTQARWTAIDGILDGKRKKVDDVRSNINITKTKVKGFINTLLSKVDSEPNIRFEKGEISDLKKSRAANALLIKDSAPENGNWVFKGLMGKKHGVKYGRTIFEYHASSHNGYESHLTLINPKYFLIDPSDGVGLDIEKANYLGRTNLTLNKKQLKEGKKRKEYKGSAVDKIIAGEASQVETYEERENRNRYFSLRGNTRRLKRDDEYDFVEWNTTMDGVRYYLLINEESKTSIQTEEFKKKFRSNLWNYASYATDPDDEEFWTDGSIEDVEQIFMGEDVLINQQFDNNEQINQPMKGFDVGAIKNPAALKWRRNGNIPFKKGTNMDRAFKVFTPSPLTNNVQMYNLLDQIAQVESGVTADTKGLSDQDTLGIYEGNLQASADRLGLLNRSYADCYNRLGLLYYNGLKEHLNSKVAIKMIGSRGVEYTEITKAGVIPNGREFDITVSSADVNVASDTAESKNKLDFLGRYKDDPTKNGEAMFETEAEIVGFDSDQIRRFNDKENTGDAEVISQAANDFQMMIQGETLEKPYSGATTGYKQYMVNELTSLADNVKPEIQETIIEYIASLEQVVVRNTVVKAKQQITSEANAQAQAEIAAPQQ